MFLTRLQLDFARPIQHGHLCREIAHIANFLITRAKARVKFPSMFFFFAQDLVSHAATLDFDQSSQILDACDYLRLSDWQFFSHFSGLSHSTSCSSPALQVNCALSAWLKLNRIFVMLCVLRWFYHAFSIKYV